MTMHESRFELLHGSKELVECPKRKDRVSGVTIRPVSLPTGQGGVFCDG